MSFQSRQLPYCSESWCRSQALRCRALQEAYIFSFLFSPCSALILLRSLSLTISSSLFPLFVSSLLCPKLILPVKEKLALIPFCHILNSIEHADGTTFATCSSLALNLPALALNDEDGCPADYPTTASPTATFCTAFSSSIRTTTSTPPPGASTVNAAA